MNSSLSEKSRSEASVTFIVKAKQLPWFSIEKTWMSPSRLSHINLQIERPTPIPIGLRSLLWELPSILKGSKMWCYYSSVMPIPSSVTSTSRIFLGSSWLLLLTVALTSISPVFWNLTALERRLNKTYCNLLLSNCSSRPFLVTSANLRFIFKSLCFKVKRTIFTTSLIAWTTDPDVKCGVKLPCCMSCWSRKSFACNRTYLLEIKIVWAISRTYAGNLHWLEKFINR